MRSRCGQQIYGVAADATAHVLIRGKTSSCGDVYLTMSDVLPYRMQATDEGLRCECTQQQQHVTDAVTPEGGYLFRS